MKYSMIDTAAVEILFEVPEYWYTENEDGVLYPVNEYPDTDEQVEGTHADILKVKGLLNVVPLFIEQESFKV